jgi:tripartite-type tricarboxylate transporter receptor subunit TctC
MEKILIAPSSGRFSAAQELSRRRLLRAKSFAVAGTLVLASSFVGENFVCGADFPVKPLRLVTAGVGGGSDFVARLVAVPLGASLGQQVIVDDRPSIAPDIVAKAQPASAMPHVMNKRLRALGVTSSEPSALAPGVPTVAAAGLPGYESVGIYGVFAPAATSAALVNRLNKEIVQVVKRSDVKERFFNAGSDAVGSTPAALAAARKADLARVGKVIKDAGIRED